jgi:hypothetical protein
LDASLIAGAGATVVCHQYPTRTPILSMWSGSVSLSIAVPDGPLADAPLRFARDLARAAAVFLAECERLAETRTPGTVDRPADAA